MLFPIIRALGEREGESNYSERIILYISILNNSLLIVPEPPYNVKYQFDDNGISFSGKVHMIDHENDN